MMATPRPTSVILDQVWLHVHPPLSKFRPPVFVEPTLARCWPRVGQIRTYVTKFGQRFATCWPIVGQIGSPLIGGGQLRPALAKLGHSRRSVPLRFVWQTLADQTRPDVVDVGRNCEGNDKLRPRSANGVASVGQLFDIFRRGFGHTWRSWTTSANLGQLWPTAANFGQDLA